MKLSSVSLSLSILLGSGFTLASQPALAGQPAADPGSSAQVSKLVEAALLEPLAQREAARSRYSRARMPAAARQVRVLAAPEKDSQGRSFVRFAVDEQRSAGWERGATLGCAYLDDGAVFVTRGGRVQSAAQYLGKGGPRATTECTAATVSAMR